MIRIGSISPHADDTELGLGGYIHRMKAHDIGFSACVGLMAYGDASDAREEFECNKRIFEAEKAAQRLGAELKPLHAAPDGGFNTVPHSQLVRAVEKFVFDRDHRLDELYVPLPAYHKDHTLTYDACISALRPKDWTHFPGRVFAYEIPGQHWGPPPPSTGKLYHRLSRADIDAKIATLECYESQRVSVRHAPGLGADAIRALAKQRGAECGAEYAELVYLIVGSV